MPRATIHIFSDKDAAEAKKRNHAGKQTLLDTYEGVDVIDSRNATDPKIKLSEDGTVHVLTIS